MYQFSVPMPYSKENTDKLIQINNEVEKSKITSLFFSLPSTCELFTGFEQPRNMLTDKSDFAFWKELMSYSLEKNFDIIYNFNLARPLDMEYEDIKYKIEKLYKLLNALSEVGVNKLRIYNIQLMEYILKHFPMFEVYISTVTNYNTIYQFRNLKELYPQVKQIVPAQDINKNFKLLNFVRNKLNLELEIMCNDGCIQGCINFFNHHGSKNYDKNFLDKSIFCNTACIKLWNENPFLYLCLNNHVYPWEIEEYGKIGINKFKLTGRDGILNNNDNIYSILRYEKYLKAIDNIKEIENFSIFKLLNNKKIERNIEKTLYCKEIIKLMPDIKHFAKYGHLCSSICGVECTYCYKCAKKVQKAFEKQKEKQMKKEMKISLPICIEG